MLAQTNDVAVISELLNHNELIPLIAILGGLLVGAIGIVCGTISGAMKVKAREATKRELAAYVAEGSLDPDKAVQLMNADNEALKIAMGTLSGGRRGGCC